MRKRGDGREIRETDEHFPTGTEQARLDVVVGETARTLAVVLRFAGSRVNCAVHLG
jgi:hypothetical protein